MRWIKSQVKELGINPNMITASGGSAGGLISILLAAGNDFNHDDDDLKINTRPSSLVLFNPQFEIAPKLPTYQPIINRSKEINPLNNLNEATPPTLILHGTEDEFIPISSVKSLQKKMTSYGVRSELVLYDRQKHEFYNKNKYSETLLEVDKFLVSLGYLNKPAD